jgi:hypothetical protein
MTMPPDFYITRAKLWTENADAQISVQEWLTYIDEDPEMEPSEDRPYVALWLGPSKYDEPCLDWRQGNIHAWWPDSALYAKMLKIAVALGAHVQDDRGNVFLKEEDWSFDPATEPELVELLKVDCKPLHELLRDFSGYVGGLATHAPDEYPDWSYRSYVNEAADALKVWGEIRKRLTRNRDEVAYIDAKLAEGLASLEKGEKEMGRAAMWEIYNMELRSLR